MAGSRLIRWHLLKRGRIDFKQLSWAPIVVVVAACFWVAPARAAQYAATPPIKGALYRDGQADRYLLGGTWLFRNDPADVGLTEGWGGGSGPPGGGAPGTGPNTSDP